MRIQEMIKVSRHLIKLLKEAFCNENQGDDKGVTPLDKAAERGLVAMRIKR